MRTMKELEKIADEKQIFKFFEGKKLSKDELVDKIAKSIWLEKHQTLEDFPEQIEPMLITEGTLVDLQEKERRGDWVLELKLNGCRGIMQIRNKLDVVITSRNKSVETYRFEEKQENVKHLLEQSNFNGLDDTIIDGELVMEVDRVDTGSVLTATRLQAATAILNCESHKAREIQDRVGKIKFVVFDLLRYRGLNLRNKPFQVRRELLEKVVVSLNNPFILLNPQFKNGFVFEFNKIIAAGDEGVVIKSLHGIYKQRGRSKENLKVKRAIYLDAYVDGYEMAYEEKGFAGLVGSLIMKAKIGNQVVIVGQIINIPYEERKLLKDSYESIYKNRVAEIRGQDWTKNGRLIHCELMGWRDDKSADETQIPEVHVKRRDMIQIFKE